MPLSDDAIVGQPIVGEENFGDGFRDDFNTLSLETSSAPGNRIGTWKEGFIHANMSEFGFTYGSDENPGDNFVHAAINFERQVYGDRRKPNPTGYQPITVNNGILTIESRLAQGASEIEWARVKDTLLNADGSLGAFVRNKQVPYVSGMISSYGRFAMSFGRFRWRCKTPYGADGSSNDVNQRKAIFPAAGWCLQDVPYGCDINGDPFRDGRTTYRPGRPNGGGILAELDADENFGESATSIHQTTHFHPPGTPNGSIDSNPKTIDIGKDIRSEWRESGVDVFPEKIAFHIDGVYTHVVNTPDEILNGLPKYIPVPGEEFNTTMAGANVAQTNGRQTHEDGSTRYMCFVMISNLARDGKFPRDLAKLVLDGGGTLPPHQDTVSLELDYCEARPLLTDNPDEYPMRFNGIPTKADRTTGGDGGGGTTSGPVSLGVNPENFTIIQPVSGVNDKTFTARARLPHGSDSTQFTYAWSAGSGLAIIGPDDQYECLFTFTASLAAGQIATHSVNLDVNPV